MGALKRCGRGSIVHTYDRFRDGPRCGSRIIRDRWFRSDDPVTCDKCLALVGKVFR